MKSGGNAMQRFVPWLCAGLLMFVSGTARAEIQGGVVKVGVLADMTGLFSDVSGRLSVEATKMAIEAVGGSVGGAKIEYVFADSQNKADVAVNIARQWLERDAVDVIVDLPNSAVALAVSELGRKYGKPIIVTTAGTSDLTGKSCAPTTIHWSYNTAALAKVLAQGVTKGQGSSWFFLTADYAFGHALERDASAVVSQAGGKILGSVKAPINTVDFSSFLLQAQVSKANIIGLANAGQDSANAIKGAHEFGLIEGGQKMAAFLLTLPDVRALGSNAKGLFLTSAFYWELNEKTRAFSAELARRVEGKHPDMYSAGVYSALLSYFRAVDELKSKDGVAVVAQMKAKPFDDPLFGKSYIRPDGRVIHDMHLFETKSPSTPGGWDLYSLKATVPGDEAFGPYVSGVCPLLAKDGK
jgi:branched-chain amino acid transport system substrate-binding protein